MMAEQDPWADDPSFKKPVATTSLTSPTAANDDWKIWQQGNNEGQTQGNSIQSWVREHMQSKPYSTDKGIGGNIGTAGRNLGAGALSAVAGGGGDWPIPLGSLTHPERPLPKPQEQPSAFARKPEESIGGYLGRAGGEATKLAGNIGTMLAIGKGVPEIGKAIPSRARAGATLEDIRSQAANVPVIPVETSGPLARFQELGQRGGASSKPATQLARRLNQNMVPTQNTPPFNFPEARDFYSNVSSQSAEDASRLNPIMRRQMGEVRSGLHKDLTTAADQIGRGEDYANAIREYARAAQLRKGLITAGKLGIGAAGAGLGGKLVKDYLIPSR